MKKFVLVVLQACLAVGLALSFNCTANASIIEQPKPHAVTFFDVTDLPARIDEPRLSKSGKQFVMDCAVANRSDRTVAGYSFDTYDRGFRREIARPHNLD